MNTPFERPKTHGAPARPVCAAGVAFAAIEANAEAARKAADAQRIDVTPKGELAIDGTTVTAALRLALVDGRALLEDDTYAFDCEAWHDGSREGVCVVGAAGAVMARRFKVSGMHMHAKHFAFEWERVFNIVEKVRTGDFRGAYTTMYPHACEDEIEYFCETVETELGDAHENPHATFKGREAYRAFLDHFERAILPAIALAEAETRG